MSGNLMTATLLDAYQWMLDAPPSWVERAKMDLINKIRREDKFEPNEAVKRGMAFEDEICKRLHLSREEFLQPYADDLKPIVSNFYDSCAGGQQQVKVTGEITVDGMDFFLFGYADIVFPAVIRDIKTTGSYKGADKYLGRAQHLIYMHCLKTYQFTYEVADFSGSRLEEYHSIKIRDTPENVEFRLKGRIKNLKQYMENNNLMDDYLYKFCRKEHK